MNIFVEEDIDRFSLQAEEDFCSEKPCISRRLALDIVSGTSTYELPDYILSIQRVTWKGWKLNPIPQRDLRDSLFSGTQGGRPFHYIYNNLGQRKIQLYPVPQETIAADQTHLYDTNIASQCIVEFWRTPDGGENTVPRYIRPRLLKVGTFKELYMMEGKGQSLKASAYYDEWFTTLTELYSNALNDLHNKPRNLNSAGVPTGYYKVPPPILPISRFGRGVDY